MKHALIVAVLLLGLPSVVAGPARPGTPPKTTGKVSVENVVVLPKGLRGPARLTPDGKQVLCIKREENRTYSYYLVGLDGKKETMLFQTAMTWDDMLGFAFGHGIWSPDGKRVAVMTADDDKGRNPRMAVYDIAAEKEELLPTRHGGALGAVFATNDVVYYADCAPIKEQNFRCTIRKHNLKNEKSEDVADYPNAVVVCLTLSPGRSRLGGILARSRDGNGDEPEFRLWAHDLDAGTTVESPPVKIDDYAGDAVWAFWDPNGQALYANGKLDPKAKGKDDFSILRFAPFSKADKKLTVLQKGKSMLTTGAFGPGKLTVTDRKERRRGAKGGVLNVKTDTVRELPQAVLLLDRRGRTGLFLDLLTERLATGRLVWK